MQTENQVQDSIQNEGQGGSLGNTSVSPAQDIANSYEGEGQENEEIQASPEEGEEVGDSKIQKNRQRWEKLLKERKQDRELIKSLQEKSQQFESDDFKKAAMVKDLLQQKPEYAALLYHLFQGRDPHEVVGELFRKEQRAEAANARPPIEEEYDERTAGYFKTIEELKSWKQQQETERETFMKEQVHNYQQDLDVEYERRLAEDGFLDQSGKAVDDTYVSLIDDITKAILQSSAKNPNIPTAQEFDHAYSTMKQCIKYMETKIRRDMSKKSVTDVPPLSGTSSGQMPIGKSKPSEHDRIMDVANSFFS